MVRTLIGGCLFIYSCPARWISFEFELISKEIRRASHEYVNKHPLPIIAQVTSLDMMTGGPKYPFGGVCPRSVVKANRIAFLTDLQQ